MIDLSDVEKRLLERFPNGFIPLSKLPPPSNLKDSTKASKRVVQAIERGERITIIGDYDVDGVISSAIAYLFFHKLGIDVEIVIPNRFKDGYGVTPKLLERIDCDLVITVDNGIHAHNSAQILKEKGTDLIITDHHNPSDTLPEAFAIVNPKQSDCPYPYKDICGATVIWLLLGELKRLLNVDIDMMEFIDLVAIATIADVMPITNLNHTIVKVGLEYFSKNERVSNQILIQELFSNQTITAEDIAFQVAPRLNSSGRIDDAIHSFNFLISDNYIEASYLYSVIDRFNQTRKEIEKSIYQDIVDEVDNSKPILIIRGEEFHEGVIGIVASRLVAKFQKPVILFSQSGEILKGSGRSIGNIDIFYLLQSASNLLLKWGGHKMAGGLSLHVSNFEKFREVVYRAMERYSPKDFLEKSNIFGELRIDNLNFDLYRLLHRFEPFGEGNEKPIFELRNGIVVQSQKIGKSGEYQKLIIEKEGIYVEVLIFQDMETIPVGKSISFLYRPHFSTFRGTFKIQALLEELI